MLVGVIGIKKTIQSFKNPQLIEQIHIAIYVPFTLYKKISLQKLFALDIQNFTPNFIQNDSSVYGVIKSKA
jgi:hypothetical protein